VSVIDLSGYSFTGKSAVYDLLSHSDSFCGFGKNFEFELLRAPGGIIELREALTGGNWSPVRSSDAIRRFLKLIDNLGGSKTVFDRVTRLGSHYDFYFPDFTGNSIDYIDKLVTGNWTSFWPFSKFQYNVRDIISYKVFSKFGVVRNDHVYLSKVKLSDFDAYTRDFLGILFPLEGNKLGQIPVINNAFEPFNPTVSSGLIRGSKSIIVDRDPRDIYLAALASSNGIGSKVGSAVVGNNVKDFVNRFLVYRSAVVSDNNSSVYRMTFESLILQFDETLSDLCVFLDVDRNGFSMLGDGFDLAKSAKNIGMWRDLSDSKTIESIEFIERELSGYCFK